MKRRWYSLVFLIMVAVAAPGCRDGNGPDPEAAKSATTAGELVGSTLANVVAKLREVETSDPALTTKRALLNRLEVENAALVPARDAIDQMLDRKGLKLSEMMFLFSEGVASRLPPVAGVAVEPNRRPKFEREYQGDQRREVMADFVRWAVIRAMLVDNGPPKPFRQVFVGEPVPPANVMDSAGSILVKFPEGRGYSDLNGWISDNPVADAAKEQLTHELGLS